MQPLLKVERPPEPFEGLQPLQEMAELLRGISRNGPGNRPTPLWPGKGWRFVAMRQRRVKVTTRKSKQHTTQRLRGTTENARPDIARLDNAAPD